MTKAQIFLLSLLILPSFLLLDFPGVKMLISGAAVVIAVCWFYKRYAEKHLNVERKMDSFQLFYGLPEPTILIFNNTGGFPIHALTARDSSDIQISAEQRHYHLFHLDGAASSRFSYPLTGRKRGSFQIGPTTIEFEDIMGIFSYQYEVQNMQDVIVYPLIHRISGLRYKSMQPQGNIKNELPIFEDPAIITGLRSYQFGDDIKKINWKVSARHEKFMVNTYQPSISTASVIIVNLFEGDYDFRGKDPYIEKTIEVTASLLRNFYSLRQEVGLATNCSIGKKDQLLVSPVSKNEAHLSGLFRDLALMQENRTMPLSELLAPSVLNISWGLSLYILTTKLDEASLYTLFDYQKSGHKITLVNIGPKVRNDMSLWNIGFQSYYAEILDGVINWIRM